MTPLTFTTGDLKPNTVNLHLDGSDPTPFQMLDTLEIEGWEPRPIPIDKTETSDNKCEKSEKIRVDLSPPDPHALLRCEHFRTVIWWNFCRYVSMSFSPMPHITSLSILNADLEISEQWNNALMLVDACTNLRTLVLSIDFTVDDESPVSPLERSVLMRRLFLNVLPGVTELESLSLSLPTSWHTSLLVCGLERLSKLTSLSLHRWSLTTDQLPNGLRHLDCSTVSSHVLPAGLTSLWCHGCDFRSVLLACPMLTDLEMSKTPMTERDFSDLFDLLRTNRHLSTVTVESYSFRDRATILALSEAVKENRTLRSFQLWHDDCFSARRCWKPLPKTEVLYLADTIRFYNSTLLELKVDPMPGTNYSDYVGPLIRRNRRRHLANQFNWERVTVYLACFRANRDSLIRRSVLPLLPILSELLAGDRAPSWKEDISVVGLVDVARFMDTRFAMAHYHPMAPRPPSLSWATRVGLRHR